MFVIEVLFGVIIPLRMFLSKEVLKSPLWLFIASSLVIFGVLLNRINNFVTAYTPPYSFGSYFPSIGEISVTIGFASLLILLYRIIVLNFPIISLPDKHYTPHTKFAIKGSEQ
jgi:Ni/Fe-hydrogenase subunit HybB-like protein